MFSRKLSIYFIFKIEPTLNFKASLSYGLGVQSTSALARQSTGPMDVGLVASLSSHDIELWLLPALTNAWVLDPLPLGRLSMLLALHGNASDDARSCRSLVIFRCTSCLKFRALPAIPALASPSNRALASDCKHIFISVQIWKIFDFFNILNFFFVFKTFYLTKMFKNHWNFFGIFDFLNIS